MSSSPPPSRSDRHTVASLAGADLSEKKKRVSKSTNSNSTTKTLPSAGRKKKKASKKSSSGSKEPPLPRQRHRRSSSIGSSKKHDSKEPNSRFVGFKKPQHGRIRSDFAREKKEKERAEREARKAKEAKQEFSRKGIGSGMALMRAKHAFFAAPGLEVPGIHRRRSSLPSIPPDISGDRFQDLPTAQDDGKVNYYKQKVAQSLAKLTRSKFGDLTNSFNQGKSLRELRMGLINNAQQHSWRGASQGEEPGDKAEVEQEQQEEAKTPVFATLREKLAWKVKKASMTVSKVRGHMRASSEDDIRLASDDDDDECKVNGVTSKSLLHMLKEGGHSFQNLPTQVAHDDDCASDMSGLSLRERLASRIKAASQSSLLVKQRMGTIPVPEKDDTEDESSTIRHTNALVEEPSGSSSDSDSKNKRTSRPQHTSVGGGGTLRAKLAARIRTASETSLLVKQKIHGAAHGSEEPDFGAE